MTLKEEKLWKEAYKIAHVAAELTEQVERGKDVDIHWMLKEARALNCAVQEIEVIRRGGGVV